MLTIKALCPALADDYVRFFDETPHFEEVPDNKCYCVCWAAADSVANTDRMDTPALRRELALKYVRSGALRGYLAYENGRAVGWCNCNDKQACLRCVSWLRFMRDADAFTDGGRIKSVFCFVVAPEYRRKGVATMLLKRAIEDARREGCTAIEAYPLGAFAGVARDFPGPMGLYEKAGFTLVQRRDNGETVMRKAL